MSYDRRTLVVSALALLVVIVGGMAVVAISSDPDQNGRQDTQGQLQEEGGPKPHIIPLPGDGKAPAKPNERGGSEQLALFGLVMAAITGIGFVVFRGGRRAQAGRAEWRAAGRTGHDGVMLDFDHLDPDVDLTPAGSADAAPPGRS